MIRLGMRRCRKCEGPVHTKDYKLYCDRCGFQGPYDRGGEVIVSRETQPPPEQTKLVFTGNHAIVSR